MSLRNKRRLAIVLAVLAGLAWALTLPAVLRDIYARGDIYLFSQEFLHDLPHRLTEPGSFRFLLQPALPIVLGLMAGRRDSLAGQLPYMLALVLGRMPRSEIARNAAYDIVNLVLVGVLLDLLYQRFVLDFVHPGVSLVVGPLLVGVPYAVSRALANRATTALVRRRAK